jgi:hypothetical protein
MGSRPLDTLDVLYRTTVDKSRVVDPDPVRSVKFCRIRKWIGIQRLSIRIRNRSQIGNCIYFNQNLKKEYFFYKIYDTYDTAEKNKTM